MYLSKIELLGFKSFAQKTTLKFNDGISCIIGPNGSGKSNIVDAIRWVLGEQKVTLLRSDKMENVIFNGSQNRKPMGLAEVSMTIENTKNIIKTDYNEVVISRRLYRSGESQYLINKAPVRLKDVLDIFMDTGMGANSYSVIELKMVESILSENKAERRQLFEEAAGVVKYKVRRRSAIRKLEATRIDLNRINDIISEVHKTVNSLSRQVGKARRYLNYTEELKQTETALSRYRYHRFLDKIRPLQRQLEEVSKIKEESHHQITIDEALLEDYKREIISIENVLQDLNNKLHEQDTRVARINQEQAVAQTKYEESGKTSERYRNEIDTFSKKMTLIGEQLNHYRDDLHELEEKKTHFSEQYAEVEAERQREVERLQAEKTEIDQLNAHFRNRLQALSEDKEQLKQKQYQLNFQQEQHQLLQASIAEHDQQIAGLEAEKNTLQQKIADAEKILQNLDKQQNDIINKIKSLDDRKHTIEDNIRRLNAGLDSAQSRLQFYEQIITNYEGHSKSAQFIMSKKAAIKGIYGTLADIISIDEQYARALEVILGDSLNYILVKDISAAKNVLEIVKTEGKGRITLIPMSRLQQLSKRANPGRPIQCPLLSDLIKSDASFEKLINVLLGDVVVADALDQALELSPQYPNLRFITAQGEMVNFNREVSGGSIERKGTLIIGRKDQLKKYSEKVKNLESELKKVQQAYEEVTKELAAQETAQEALNKRHEDQQKQIIALKQREKQIEYETGKLNAERKTAEDRMIIVAKTMKDINQQIQKLEHEVEEKQVDLNTLEKETISRTSSYEHEYETLQAFLEDVQRARLDVTNIENQLANRQNDIRRAENNINELKNDIRQREDEINRIKENQLNIEKDSEKRRQEQESIWELRDQYESERDKIEQNYHEVKDKIKQIEEQTKKYRQQHNTSLEKSRYLELQINENKYKAENIREYILKEYAEDVEIGIPYEDFNEDEAGEKIELMKTRIKNLGPVNPLAVSEYEKEKERLDFLMQQNDDLVKAEKSLLETIDTINKTARKQFVETFNAIKTNFEKVFVSFFESGEGTLKMAANEDPLEADIEIEVRTKSRKLQTLSLLSGGEKTLTAISLLFAIYLVKPSPFCILDEVDAPLDDVNIGRFTEALTGFADNTQFIIVTHNKRTMESAETLYGVTMEEEGISKLVSVKFN